MAKQYLIINEDQILVDLDLVFAAIRDAGGDWEQVEQDLLGMLDTVQGMVDAAQEGQAASGGQDAPEA